MIKFTVESKLPLSPDDICDQIFDPSKWISFKGYGPIPGIENVTVTAGDDTKVNTKFSVQNTDGSFHKETVINYMPGKSLTLRMDNFSPPLNSLASHFIEKWVFVPKNEYTVVKRSFEIHSQNSFTSFPLWIISFFLKKAVQAHLNQLGRE